MKYRNQLKEKADTYYAGVLKPVLIITVFLALQVLYLVLNMQLSPDLAVKYFYQIPTMIKNVLLICVFSAAAGAVLEIGTN